jgi:hypothetical protein
MFDASARSLQALDSKTPLARELFRENASI